MALSGSTRCLMGGHIKHAGGSSRCNSEMTCLNVLSREFEGCNQAADRYLDHIHLYNLPLPASIVILRGYRPHECMAFKSR